MSRSRAASWSVYFLDNSKRIWGRCTLALFILFLSAPAFGTKAQLCVGSGMRAIEPSLHRVILDPRQPNLWQMFLRGSVVSDRETPNSFPIEDQIATLRKFWREIDPKLTTEEIDRKIRDLYEELLSLKWIRDQTKIDKSRLRDVPLKSKLSPFLARSIDSFKIVGDSVIVKVKLLHSPEPSIAREISRAFLDLFLSYQQRRYRGFGRKDLEKAARIFARYSMDYSFEHIYLLFRASDWRILSTILEERYSSKTDANLLGTSESKAHLLTQEVLGILAQFPPTQGFSIIDWRITSMGRTILEVSRAFTSSKEHKTLKLRKLMNIALSGLPYRNVDFVARTYNPETTAWFRNQIQAEPLTETGVENFFPKTKKGLDSHFWGPNVVPSYFRIPADRL